MTCGSRTSPIQTSHWDVPYITRGYISLTISGSVNRSVSHWSLIYRETHLQFVSSNIALLNYSSVGLSSRFIKYLPQGNMVSDSIWEVTVQTCHLDDLGGGAAHGKILAHWKPSEQGKTNPGARSLWMQRDYEVSWWYKKASQTQLISKQNRLN